MKAAKVVLIVLFCALIINWIRGGQDFHLARVLPFMGGHHPSIYDVAAIIFLCVMLPWGLRRLRRRGEELQDVEHTWLPDVEEDDPGSGAENEADTEEGE